MKTLRKPIGILFLFSLVLVFSCSQERKEADPHIVNDVTQLNPIKVDSVIAPTTTEQIIDAVKKHKGPIAIGGGRFSMGGQTATEKALQIDMRQFNKVVSFSKADKEITVQAGIRWRELIQFIDRHNLSVKIMQTYANFTVGGALSVNAHGRYIGQGPIIRSVKEIKVVLADGTLVTASPVQNQEVFYSAIGGYGGIGVIVEATLFLTDNCKVERIDTLLSIKDYQQYFKTAIEGHKNIIFHNADIYPHQYKEVHAVSYVKTQKPLTIKERLKPNEGSLLMNRMAIDVVATSSFGKWLRKEVGDPLFYAKDVVEWRNYEATYDVRDLEPSSRKAFTYVLQEYFVPVNRFDTFYPKMAEILREHKVNVINISIRHAKKDPGAIMAWAKTDVFAFVIYYRQGTEEAAKERVKQWTQKLIDAAIAEEGAYYLPYQLLASPQQLEKAYPNVPVFFSMKKKYDPTYKFRNKFFDAYLPSF